MTPRLLWVTDEVPDRDLGGGSIRQYHLLKRAATVAEVDLVLVGELADDGLLAALHKVKCIPRPADPLTAWGHGPARTARRRIHNLSTMLPGRPPSEVAINSQVIKALRAGTGDTSRYDVVQIEHEHLAGLVPRHRSSRWAITLHNLLSTRYHQRAEVSHKPRVRRLWDADARRADAWERRISRRFDLIIAASEEDAATVGGPVAVVPNGVDLDRFRATPLPGGHRMIFSASFNYEPNIDGAEWLCEEILPRVRESIPDATLLLVGREPDKRALRLADLPGVEAHFDVAAVAPFLESARVALVTLRQGSGTRLKALEAMAAGRPLVGSDVGLEGLGLQNGVSACIANNGRDLAQAAVRLLSDDGMARSIAEAARLIAVSRFGWDRVSEEYLTSVWALTDEPANPSASRIGK